MATAFGVDAAAAVEASAALRLLTGELAALDGTVTPEPAVTGSAVLTAALRRFAQDSRDRRSRLLDLVDEAVDRLDALTTGVAAIDGVLVSALGERGAR